MLSLTSLMGINGIVSNGFTVSATLDTAVSGAVTDSGVRVTSLDSEPLPGILSGQGKARQDKTRQDKTRRLVPNLLFSTRHFSEEPVLNTKVVSLAISGALLATGCVPGDGTCVANDPCGFFSGVWHGWMAPLSLAIGFFSENIRVYEIRNTGWWYDLGYYMAIIGGCFGLSFSRSSKS